MIVRTIKTDKIRPGDMTLPEFLDTYITELSEGAVIAIASKVVSICEGNVVLQKDVDKDELIKQETAYYLPRDTNPYHVTLSITRNLLVAAGGVDESNSAEYFVLWPVDKQASANVIREHLAKKFGLQKLGVVITDSTTRPFQWGTTGLGISFSGFKPLKDYIGTEDIFGRKLVFQKNNIMNGLAATAVVVMGEGNEQTPIAVIEDLPFVEFVPRNPSAEELESLRITIDEDLYGPVLRAAPWEKGNQS